MPSDLQITNIKDQANANSAITIASDGQVTIAQNNPTITLGSNTTFPDSIYKAGSEAFMATYNSSAWVELSVDAILAFNTDSGGARFDTGSNYNTSTYKYTVPATGVYTFYYSIYTAQNDSNNSFGFTTNNGDLEVANHSVQYGTYMDGADDNMQTLSMIFNVTSGDTVWIQARTSSDIFTGHSFWGGCRLK